MTHRSTCDVSPEIHVAEPSMRHEDQAVKTQSPQSLKRANDNLAKAEQHQVVGALNNSDSHQGRKRKQSSGEQDTHKRTKICANDKLPTIGAVADLAAGEPGERTATATDPVAYWASKHHWPEDFATMTQSKSGSSNKRPPSLSYSASYRNGEVPRAHTRAYENELAKSNVYMDEFQGRKLVSQESKLLCLQLLQARYGEPEYTPYPLSKFDDVWQRVQNHNETRLFRDITPLLIPSPELLFICGQEKLEHVTEALSAEWRMVKPLGGPNPKPDQVIGPTYSAFDEEEVAKLQNHTSFERATLFTENVYFPFLLVEAKSGEDGINKADRQNMHSSSMAVNAILQLFLVLDDGRNRAAALNGEILLFSISHDNERVKLFGHFAVVDKEKVSFYRYHIDDFLLNLEAHQGRQKTYDFVQAVYNIFYPIHLARIKNVLAETRDHTSVSVTSNISVDKADPQNLPPSAPSSQAQFKKPDFPPSMNSTELNILREQMAEQQRQMAEQQRQSAEQQDILRQQMAEQQRQSQEQLNFLYQQLVEERKERRENSELIKQLLNRPERRES